VTRGLLSVCGYDARGMAADSTRHRPKSLLRMQLGWANKCPYHCVTILRGRSSAAQFTAVLIRAFKSLAGTLSMLKGVRNSDGGRWKVTFSRRCWRRAVETSEPCADRELSLKV